MALKSVLLAVGPGDSDRAEKLARTLIDIAGPSDATVVLAHVFTDDEYESAIEQLNIDDSTTNNPGAVARQHGTIREISNLIQDAGLSYEVQGAVGSHGDEIIRLATDLDSDLIIVGGKKRSPTRKAVFGSSAQQIILSAPCPVTFVRSD